MTTTTTTTLAEQFLAWAPAAAFIVVGTALGFTLRFLLGGALARWAQRTPWRFDEVLVPAMRWPLPVLAFLAGVEGARHVAPISAAASALVHRLAMPVVVIVATWMLADAAQGLIKAYTQHLPGGARIAPLVQQTALIAVAGTGCLYLLAALGVSPTPVLVVVGVVAGAAALAVRNVLPDLLAGAGLAAGLTIRRGDRIRIDDADEGVVTHIGWRATTLRSERGDLTIVPNSRILSGTVAKRSDSARIDGARRAPRPLTLKTRATLTELTGRRARDLAELADELERAPLECIYRHSLGSVSDHDWLAPTPVSDFSRFVGDVLRAPALRERLDELDPCACGSLAEYRTRLVALCREHVAAAGAGDAAPPGEEFHFVKSRVFVFGTGLVAHDLRELAEALRTVPPASLMMHLFETRLGLDLPADDLGAWIRTSYGDDALAASLDALDPYTRSAEGLRNTVIALLEERMRP